MGSRSQVAGFPRNAKCCLDFFYFSFSLLLFLWAGRTWNICASAGAAKHLSGLCDCDCDWGFLAVSFHLTCLLSLGAERDLLHFNFARMGRVLTSPGHISQAVAPFQLKHELRLHCHHHHRHHHRASYIVSFRSVSGPGPYPDPSSSAVSLMWPKSGDRNKQQKSRTLHWVPPPLPQIGTDQWNGNAPVRSPHRALSSELHLLTWSPNESNESGDGIDLPSPARVSRPIWLTLLAPN